MALLQQLPQKTLSFKLQLTLLCPRGAPAQPQMIPYGGLLRIGNATMTTHHIRRIIPAARSEWPQPTAISRKNGDGYNVRSYERTATYAAAAVVTANDPVVVAEEAATLDACRQAMMGAWQRLIDRSMVTVSHYFARDVPLFFCC